MLYSRYVELCKERLVAPSAVAISLGYSAASFSRWKDVAEKNNGIVSLRSDMLVKIADYFGVSIDYLCGRTKKRESASTVLSDFASNPRKMILLDEANGMSDESLDQVIRVARIIKGVQEEN